MNQPIVSEGRAAHALDAIPALESVPPRWVRDTAGPIERVSERGSFGDVTRELALLQISLDAVTRLPAGAMRAAVSDAYRQIGAALLAMGRAPIRFWNFIPDLGRSMGPDVDRYMVFNAGRHDAFSAAVQADHPLVRALATASAVGVEGTDLTIYCLAARRSGTPVENPRQKSSWMYSSKYGPLPPYFSRATIATIGGRPRLLIGGTASIVGEDSTHHVDVAAQLEETLQNLASVVTAARSTSEPPPRALERLIDMRVYVRREDDARTIRREIERRCPRIESLEMVRARICRPELLLEIEAVADI